MTFYMPVIWLGLLRNKKSRVYLFSHRRCCHLGFQSKYSSVFLYRTLFYLRLKWVDAQKVTFTAPLLKMKEDFLLFPCFSQFCILLDLCLFIPKVYLQKRCDNSIRFPPQLKPVWSYAYLQQHPFCEVMIVTRLVLHSLWVNKLSLLC